MRRGSELPATRTCRAVLVAVTVCALGLGAPACAFAHAILVQSQPAPGMELGSSPAQITATFGEPLNRQLSNLTVIGPGGSAVHLRVSVAARGTELVVRPLARLARGLYQVRWHSVSADDGHALDGAYYFGVQSTAPRQSTQAEASPLAGTGWLRALLRGAFDGALIVFCGGVLIAAMLARGREPAAWLIPCPGPGSRPLTDARRLWRFTVRVGMVAVLVGALTGLADAAAAAGSLSAPSLHAYFFTNLAGEARVAMLAALVLAAWLAARRAPRSSSVFVVVALTTLALSGHANSAHPRALALGSDLLHLLAASVWLGGIAHIAWAWLPRVGLLDETERRAVMEGVLAQFGRIALPAFVILAIAGLTNAVIELGSVSALWQDGYGQVLLMKVALVGSIALASHAHAIRIRPRLLVVYPHPPQDLERRHWRLLAGEPVIAAGVALAAAVLVAFPPPRSQPAQRPPAPTLTVPSVPRPLSAAVAPDELSVAEEAGPLIVAAWVTHRPHGGLDVRLHTLATNEQPLDVSTRILGAAATVRCGVGCRTAQLMRSPAALTVRIIYHGRHYRARLPVRWNASADVLARRLLAHVVPGQLALRDVRIHETLRGGPSVPNITDYQLQAPDRFAFTFSRGSQPLGETVIVASGEWERSAGKSSWEQSRYGGGTQPFKAESYLGWWAPYARAPRLMALKRTPAGTVADIATLSELQDVGPVWLRLRLDITHRRLERLRMITAGHFMTQEWGAFNRPLEIRPPVTATGRR